MSRPPGKPDFLVLGAPKCGTTSLCSALERHPEIFLSRPKEPVFFEREYERGLDHYWREYFGDWEGEPVAGEGRTYNLYLPFVPARVRQSLPHARLVAALRDPVERAHSHWWHRVSRGYEQRSFEEAIEEELTELEAGRPFEPARDPEAWARNFFPGTRGTHADVREVRYVEMGHYDEQLRRWRERFHEERLRVVFFEDLVGDGGGEIVRDLVGFLGADPGKAETGLPEENVARERVKSRSAFLLERLSWGAGITRLVPKRLRTAVRRALSSEAERPAVGGEVRRRLREHYRPHVRSLEELCGRDLHAWRGDREGRSEPMEATARVS